MLVVLGVLAGCGGHAKEGDICQGGDPQCTEDKAFLLECESDGHYRALPCPGPGGCVFDNNAATPILECDLTGTHSGDECSENYGGFVMCVDAANKQALVCGGDIWRNTSCPTECENGVGGVGSPQSVGVCD